jgi:hypothetical protein
MRRVRSWVPTGPLAGFVCLLALLGVLAATAGLDASGGLAGVTYGARLAARRSAIHTRLYALLGLDQTTCSMPATPARTTPRAWKRPPMMWCRVANAGEPRGRRSHW